MPETTENQSFPALTFEPDEFIQYVKDHDLSEAEAYEFLATVWIFMVAWVDMNIGIHPIQQGQGGRKGNADGNKPALDHQSALVLTCREAFNNTQDKTVQRPKRRGAGKRDS